MEVHQNSWTGECGPDSGCCIALRAPDNEKRTEEDDERQDDSDSDYEYQSQEEDEAYEYESDASASEPEQGVEMDAGDESEEDMSPQGDSMNLRTWLALRSERGRKQDVFLPLPQANRKSRTARKGGDASDGSLNHNHMEHIAGPGCRDNRGYHGFAISFEEMNGCKTLQCLERKTNTWMQQPDDQDFERDSNYFLSGLCDRMPSRDIDCPRVTPARHGLTMPRADNIVWMVSNPSRIQLLYIITEILLLKPRSAFCHRKGPKWT